MVPFRWVSHTVSHGWYHKSHLPTDKSLIKYDLEEKKDMNKTFTKENLAKSNPKPYLVKKILLQYLP